RAGRHFAGRAAIGDPTGPHLLSRRPSSTPGVGRPGAAHRHRTRRSLNSERTMLDQPLSSLELEVGRPAMLHVEDVDDAVFWVAEHREALRKLVDEQGALLVRGLALREVGVVDTVFRLLGELMVEKEAFAARTRYRDALYSSSRWPSGQP